MYYCNSGIKYPNFFLLVHIQIFLLKNLLCLPKCGIVYPYSSRFKLVPLTRVFLHLLRVLELATIISSLAVKTVAAVFPAFPELPSSTSDVVYVCGLYGLSLFTFS